MDWLKNRLDALEIDFIRPRWIFAAISIVAVISSWLLFFVAPLVTDGAIGPRWGIDFQGGTEIHLQFNHDEDGNPVEGGPVVTIEQVRGTLERMELGDDVVQRIGEPSDQEYQIRIKDTTVGYEDDLRQVMDLMEGTYGEDAFGEIRVEAEVGTRVTLPFKDGKVPPLEEIQEVLISLEGMDVQESREPGEVAVLMPGLADNIKDALREGIEAPFIVKQTESVGPKVGGDLRSQGFIAIAITLGLVLVYIAFRFDIAFAPGAVLALLHDVSLTAGVFVLLGLEINLPIVGALLTIVGYSLNDTIVIYDRIRENQDRYSRQDMKQLINISINETMTRTVATSVTTFLAITPFLMFGGNLIPDLLGMPSAGSVIWSFAFAMLLGIVFGTYSTIYVASPTILVMQDVKPWLNKLLPDFGGEDEEGDIDERALTASEQRRRERAEKARGGSEA